MRYLFALIILAGCSVPLERMAGMTPADCRAYGVNVPDGAEATGTVVNSEFKWIGTGALAEACGGDHGQDGCCVGVTYPWPDPNNNYNIFYSESSWIPWHEYCHGRYEQSQHTIEFDLMTFQNRRGTGNTRHQVQDRKL